MQVDSQIIMRPAEVSEFKYDAANCFQIKKNLDELFSGRTPLEKMDPIFKRFLFAHLETCRDCCRSFDARVRFHVPKSGLIY